MRPRHRWEHNIKITLKVIVCEDADCIHLDNNRVMVHTMKNTPILLHFNTNFIILTYDLNCHLNIQNPYDQFIMTNHFRTL
jgi:hypothetical protein